jgi:flagellar M-ring protein FliF
VAFVDFITEPAAAPPTGMDKILQSPLTPWITALLVLALALLAWALMKRREKMIMMRQRAEQEAEESAYEAIVAEEIKVEDLIDAGLSPEEKEKRRIREEIDRIINEELKLPLRY